MTASTRIDIELTAPIVDYEPPPIVAGTRTSAADLLRVVPDSVPEFNPAEPHLGAAPPATALVFADAALRRVLEVSDGRRPTAQLRPLAITPLFEAMASWPRQTRADGAAVLRRVRLRTAREQDGLATAVEVFATFSRGPRLHAAAGRVEMVGGRWQFVALQLG
ncbi:hypothetical protein EB75_28375 [Mycobacterium sp. ST-F2]|uniref:Rv3235 family protein n=1 Tax=Mycobacterium sp. ST-F2 TaxID=1490484 RepID=UPI00093D31CE|nr:Rv3235 family protein [Mycobacterium sp. ST-F2]OKH78062.1 hypothetical protein EB75_28375 [Mycobacterium sp. ST-F2]